LAPLSKGDVSETEERISSSAAEEEDSSSALELLSPPQAVSPRDPRAKMEPKRRDFANLNFMIVSS
jgi:hypothetical protein